MVKSKKETKAKASSKKLTAPPAAKVEEKEAGIGHNGPSSGTIKKTVDELEKLDLQIADLNKIKREKKAYLKGQGVSITALNQIMRERKMESDVRANFYEDCHIIRDALEMQLDMFNRMQFDNPQGLDSKAPTEAEIADFQAKQAQRREEAAAVAAAKAGK